MRELLLIVKREYLSRIKKKSFLVLTILIPILILGSVLMPLLLSQTKDSEIKPIAVIDLTGRYASHLHSFDEYIFDTIYTTSLQLNLNLGQDIFGVLQINQDLSLDTAAVSFHSQKQIPFELQNYINTTLSDLVKQQRVVDLASQYGIDKQIVADILTVLAKNNLVKIDTTQITADVEKEYSAFVASTIALIFPFLMYFFILMYGTMVLNGVVEEKSSRIVEVLICSVRPFNLMMGKIIGIGLTGLTQLFIWLLFLLLVLINDDLWREMLTLSVNSFDFQYFIKCLFLINWVELIAYFLLLFIGGYMIYASIFAMFGASVDNAQDTQQFVMPVSILFIFSLYTALYSIQNPDGALAFWCSIIPFTSPIVMMVRIPFGVPMYEKMLSIALLYLTILLIVYISAKIYRVGILMYGKKPSYKDLYKWFTAN